MENELQYRFERKFLLPGFDLVEVQDLVLRHPAMFKEIFHERSINNLYFDDPAYRFYEENVSGVANRKKVRIRWYGDILGLAKKPTLEYKIKKGVVGTKISYPLHELEVQRGLSREQLQNCISQSKLPLEVSEDLRPLGLSLINRYSRRYFLSANGKFRITLDFNLEYYNSRRHFTSFAAHHKDTENMILELKYAREDEDLGPGIAAHFPFRLSKSSKYVMGISHFQQFMY